jgi:GGDEF domain-containing protein
VAVAHVDSAEHARDLLGRVRTALAAPLDVPDDPGLRVGVSVGLATADGDAEASRLIAEADRAMYVEKNAARAARGAAQRRFPAQLRRLWSPADTGTR